MLEPLLDRVYTWDALDAAQKRHLNGYALVTKAGLVLVDPPAMPEVVLPALEALGKPKIVILTGRPSERRARQFKDWYGAKILAPESDRKSMRVPVDHYYAEGETLPGGFVAVALAHQRTAGECALFHAGLRLLIASYLVGEPAGLVQLEDRGLYANFSRALEAQLKLLPLEFDALLPGRGRPVLKEGRVALAKYLAGFAGGEPTGHW